MKKRILVTPLGTGSRNEKNPYIKANYKFEDSKETKESYFILEVLCEKSNPDELIIIGTVKSCWHQLYRYFAEKNGDFDENYEKYLSEYIQSHNHKSEVCDFEEFDKEKLISVMPCKTRIILIRYGLNEKELLENFELLSEIEESFEKLEENQIILDITHSFRSLPIYQFLFINYFMRVCKYNVKIEAIYYGMLESKYELDNITPIINLKILNELLEWINSINEYNNQGNITSLIKLLRHKNNQELAEYLEEFDFSLNSNNLSDIRNALNKIFEYKNKNIHFKGPEGIMIPLILQNLEDSFGKNFEIDYYLQFNLAKWYLTQKRFGLSAITISETIRTFFASIEKENNPKKSITDESTRITAFQNVKKNLEKLKVDENQEISYIVKLMNDYPTINKIRIIAAHNMDTEKQVIKGEKINTSYEEIEKILIYYLSLMEKCMNSEKIINLLKDKLLVPKKGENINSHIKTIILIPDIQETINTDKKTLQGSYCNAKFKKLPNDIEKLWNVKVNKDTCYKNCEKIAKYIRENYSNEETIIAITEGRPNMIRALTKILLENNYDVYDYLIILDKDGKTERHSMVKVKLD